jgi:20S proteasome alpha/beta subunit
MSTEQGLKLAQSILKKVLKREYSAEKIECVIVKRSGLKKEIIK